MAQARLLLLGLAILCLSAARGQSQTKHGMMIEDVGVVNAILSSGETPAFTGPTILAALETIGTTKRTLLLTSGTWVMTSNLTIPANVTLWLPADATMQVATGVTVTVKGPVQVDGCGAFTGLGTVLLPAVLDLNVCWFGTVGDLSADDTDAIQRAATAMTYVAPGGTSLGVGCCASVLRFPAGSFKLTAPIVLRSGGTVTGAGPANTFLVDYTTTGNMLVTQPTSGIAGRLTVRDLTLTALTPKTGGAALVVTTTAPGDPPQQQLLITNVFCMHHYTCFSLLNTAYGHIVDNHLDNIRGSGIVVQTSSNPDAGDLVIAHNTLAGSIGTGTGLLIYTNGVRVLGNKFLGLLNGLVANPSTTFPLGDVLIANNSFENQQQYAILIQAGATDRSGINFQINSNQLALLQGATVGSTLIAASGALAGLTIQGNMLSIIKVNQAAIVLGGDAWGHIPDVFTISGNVIVGQNLSNTLGISVPNDASTRGVVSGNYVYQMATPYQGTAGVVQAGPLTLTALAVFGAPGSTVYCSDCKVTSGSDNTCTTAGTGAQAVKIGAVWRCFASQN